MERIKIKNKMETIDINKIPEEVTRITSAIENAGFEAYLVGGCVRDLFLDRIPND
jgi:tRNA nucleotidyltransferase/poly(A) polymerase